MRFRRLGSAFVVRAREEREVRSSIRVKRLRSMAMRMAVFSRGCRPRPMKSVLGPRVAAARALAALFKRIVVSGVGEVMCASMVALRVVWRARRSWVERVAMVDSGLFWTLVVVDGAE